MPTYEIVHPFSRDLYRWDRGEGLDGEVIVTHEGAWGRFKCTGEWIEGEVRYADPLMCLWIGVGTMKAGTAFARNMPIDE